MRSMPVYLGGKQKRKAYKLQLVRNIHCGAAGIVDALFSVRWEADASTSQLSFFSVSADGCIMRWTLLKSKLESEVVGKIFATLTELQSNKFISPVSY